MGIKFPQFLHSPSPLIGGGKLGMADLVRNTVHLDPTGLQMMTKTVHDLFPIMQRTRVVRCWAGIEGHVVDELPVIGPGSTEPGILHAFGFSSHGFQLGPVIGRILAELITEGHSTLPITPFSITRFATYQKNKKQKGTQ